MKILTTLVIAAISAPSLADTFIVEANAMSFNPNVLNVVPGDVIEFRYITGYPHTVTSGTDCIYDGLYFNEPLDSSSPVFSWTVPADAPTEIPFFCILHCSMGMTGVINVEVPEGHMVIGMVNIMNPFNLTYSKNEALGTATLAYEADGTSDSLFSVAVEIEVTDVDVEVEVSGTANAYLYHPASATETIISTGTYTLDAGERYLWHGDVESGLKENLSISLTWAEDGSEENPQMNAMSMLGSGSVNASGDNFAMHVATGSGSLELEGEGEMFLGVLGDVTSATLTLPASGTEGMVEIPAGLHTILVEGLGMLWIPESGGGDVGGMAEDVTGDGIVDVSDLLAVISAWGSTSP